MRGHHPSPRWGEIHLEIFYDMGLFHREDTAPRALALEQSRKEKSNPPGREPMKDRLLQLLLKGHTVQDAIAFGNCSAGAGSTPCSWNPPPIR